MRLSTEPHLIFFGGRKRATVATTEMTLVSTTTSDPSKSLRSRADDDSLVRALRCPLNGFSPAHHPIIHTLTIKHIAGHRASDGRREGVKFRADQFMFREWTTSITTADQSGDGSRRRAARCAVSLPSLTSCPTRRHHL